jgi:archaellum component FlaC
MSEDRLNRIEQKLDRLVDIVESIARVEEKMAATDSKLNRLEFRVDGLEGELDEVNRIARDNSSVASFADKLFWVIIGGGVSLIAWVLKTNIN